MIEARYNKRQADEAQRKLQRFLKRMEDRTTPNRAVSVALYSWFVRNYDSEGSLVGGWEPLAESTVREKERIGKQRMLVRTGATRASFTPFYSKTNAGLRSESEIAGFHEHGTSRMPARTLLPPREVVDEIGLRVYAHYVEGAAREANR